MSKQGYGKLVSMFKNDKKVVLTFEHGVISIDLEKNYEEAWLVVTEMKE